jgi:cyclohexa-1,5-dienecarbonyl-CoA hydratase
MTDFPDYHVSGEAPPAEAPKHIVCKEKEGIIQIFLNRPPINAMNLAMIEEMNSALGSLQYRNDLKVLIFSGAGGKAFSGGFAPEDFQDDKAFQMIEGFGHFFQQLLSINLPTESSKFGFPDIRMGLFPAIGANILQRYIPYKRAAEMILTGEIISARDAEKIGLLNMVVADDKLQEQAGLMARKLLQFSGPVLQLARKAMTESQGKPIEDAMRSVEEIYLTQLLNLEDSKEGVAAFIEKRKPVWKNQ